MLFYSLFRDNQTYPQCLEYNQLFAFIEKTAKE